MSLVERIETEPEPAATRDWDRESVLVLTGLALVAGLWWYSLDRFDLNAASSVGIIAVVPLPYLAALALLAGLFGQQLMRPQIRTTEMTLIVVVLVLMLFSLPNLIDGTGAWPTGYVHVGFVQYISENHSVPKNFDARFSWPGFFAAAAYLVDIAGLDDARPLLVLAPALFELLALPAMLLLARRTLGAERPAWLAVVLFYCGVWFGQDYFAPQAVGYLLYVSILAVLLWTVGAEKTIGRNRPPLPARLSESGATAIHLVLVVLTVGLVITHQLTPISLILELLVITVLGVTRFRWFWLTTVLIFVTWFSYGAADFWAGHIDGLLGGVGDVSSSVGKGITARVQGDPEYLRMQQFRMLWSLLYLVVAGIGAVVMIRRRQQLGLTLTALAVAPFGVMAVQSYGGEVVLRCFLYAMPFLAVLCAAALSPVLAWRQPVSAPVIGGLVLVAAVALITARGTNVSFERVSPGDVAAAEFASTTAPDGGTIAIVESFSPLRYEKLLSQKVVSLPTGCEIRLVACIADLKPDLIYLSDTQENYGRLRQSLPEGWLMKTAVADLVATGDYRITYDQPGDVVLDRRQKN
jgi:hypothetical protein